MGKYKLPWNNFVPQTFGDAVAYEQQIKYLAQRLQKIEEEGMPTPDLTDLKRRVTELETEVLTIQNELQELDVEAVTARLNAVDEAITALETEQANQSVEVTSHGNRLTALESTVETQQGTVDNLSGRVATTDQAVNRLADDLTQVTQAVAGKQDKLTAGANITIENNVISSTGGGGSVILDTEVTEDSQHAVTSEGIYNAIETAKSTLQTAHAADITRIDGELNTKATTASVTALRTDVEGDISRIETEYKAADGEIDTRLDNLEASQTATDASVATLQTTVTNIQQTQTSQGNTITGLGNKMTTAEGNITQLQTDTSQLSGTVQGMQTTIQGKQDKLTAGTNITIENNIISATGGSGGQVTLDDTVTETSSNGVKSSGIYTAIETAKSGLQESITDIDGRVDTLEADNDTNKSNISTLQTSVASAQDDIGTLQTGLTQESSDRETADQALRVSINGNSSAINTLRTNTESSITQLQTDVAGKQDKLTAGTNITIENNVISSSGGGGGTAPIELSTASQIYDNRNNSAQPVSASTVGYLSQTPYMMDGVLNDSSGEATFILPISTNGGTPSFETVYTKMVWMNDLPAQYREYANIATYLGPSGRNAFYTRYMFARDNEWIAYNATPLSNFGMQVASVATQDMPDDANNSKLLYNMPLSIRTPKSVTDHTPGVCPPKIMKGYCVWLKDLASSADAYPIGVMLVELDQIYQAYKTNYAQTGALTGSYKCVKWFNTINTLPTEDTNFLITPIY